eukprot:Filipodium_phascolosomae@DN1880_c0_g1_i3.p1
MQPMPSWKNGGIPILAAIISSMYKEIGSDPSGEASLQALEKYCKNLTSLAKEGKLHSVIGRDEEIRRTIQVPNVVELHDHFEDSANFLQMLSTHFSFRPR